jgi:hypothetical protein
MIILKQKCIRLLNDIHVAIELGIYFQYFSINIKMSAIVEEGTLPIFTEESPALALCVHAVRNRARAGILSFE